METRFGGTMASLHPPIFWRWIFWRKLISLLLLGAAYLTYVLLGGVIFWKLEGDEVMEEIASLDLKKIELLEVYQCLGQEGLQEVGEFILASSQRGMSLKSNHTAGGFWKFTSSAVFAATLVTTIGYGNIIPTTALGQIFCVVFAIFGIPLNMLVLNRVGKYMLAIERKFCTTIAKKTSHQRLVQVGLHMASFVTSAILYLVCPMFMFSTYENWNYSQAVYYCFITLSTVGFGDLVADNNPDLNYPEWYGCLMAVWIFFGMAWLALVINHSIDLLERLNNYLKNKGVGHSKDNEKVEEVPVKPEIETEAQDKQG